MHYNPISWPKYLLFVAFVLGMLYNFYLILKYWKKQADENSKNYKPRS